MHLLKVRGWRFDVLNIHFGGNFQVANFVEDLAEFDGLFSNINRVDKVPDEVADEGTKG